MWPYSNKDLKIKMLQNLIKDFKIVMLSYSNKDLKM